MSFNRKSQWMVDNVYQGISHFNPYDEISKYDEGTNTQCVKWEKYGCIHRIYKFHANENGVITSMTVHGVNVISEYNAISNSKVAFGLPINGITTKDGPDGLFVDVSFANY